MVWLRANLAGFPGSSSTTFPIGTWTSGTSRLSLSALTRRHVNATTLSCLPSRIKTKKNKFEENVGTCGVAVATERRVCPSCEAGVASKQRNAKQNTRTKAGMPRWTDRNHERRYHIHKLTKRCGEARGLASRGTRPAVLGNNVLWTMAVSYALETKSLGRATSLFELEHQNKNMGTAPDMGAA